MTVVRPGVPDDVPGLLAVFNASEAARRGADVATEQLDKVESRLGAGWLLVAEDGDEPVGFGAGFDALTDDGAGDEVIPGLAHLGLVFIRPDHWGRGVGGQVVDKVLDEARRRAYQRIQLWTHEDNERAQRLYTGRGFHRDGRSKVSEHDGRRIGLWVRDL